MGMTESTAPRPKASRNWALLLARIYDSRPLQCPRCGSATTVLAFILDPAVIKRILDHLNLESEPPVTLPARSPPQGELEFAPAPGRVTWTRAENPGPEIARQRGPTVDRWGRSAQQGRNQAIRIAEQRRGSMLAGASGGSQANLVRTRGESVVETSQRAGAMGERGFEDVVCLSIRIRSGGVSEHRRGISQAARFRRVLTHGAVAAPCNFSGSPASR